MVMDNVDEALKKLQSFDLFLYNFYVKVRDYPETVDSWIEDDVVRALDICEDVNICLARARDEAELLEGEFDGMCGEYLETRERLEEKHEEFDALASKLASLQRRSCD